MLMTSSCLGTGSTLVTRLLWPPKTLKTRLSTIALMLPRVMPLEMIVRTASGKKLVIVG